MWQKSIVATHFGKDCYNVQSVPLVSLESCCKQMDCCVEKAAVENQLKELPMGADSNAVCLIPLGSQCTILEQSNFFLLDLTAQH